MPFYPPLERKFALDLVVPPPDSPAPILNLVRALTRAKTEKTAITATNTELLRISTIFPSKKALQQARLRRITVLRHYLSRELVRAKRYKKSLLALRFHVDSYLPSARNEIDEFVQLFALSKTPDESEQLARSELNHLYRLVMGRSRGTRRDTNKARIASTDDARNLAYVKNLLTLRRTALRAFLGDEIALVESGSPHTKGYLALALDRSEYQQLRHHNETMVDLRRENQTHVRETNTYLLHAIELLRSTDSMRIIAGLLALTGRRPIEVASTGTISEIDDEGGDYCVVFKGQAKTKGRDRTMHGVAFPIPVLCAPYVVLEAWRRLRNSSRGREIADMSPRMFHARLGTTIGYIVGVEFSRYLLGKAKAQPKDLRGVYAEICNQIYNGDGLVGRRIMDNGLYYSRILGHGVHSGQVSDAYKAFVLDDLPAEPEPRPLPAIGTRPTKPRTLRRLSTLGLTRRPQKTKSR